jgi:hypothetical protein
MGKKMRDAVFRTDQLGDKRSSFYKLDDCYNDLCTWGIA